MVAIQTKQPIDTSREELYRAVEDLCVHKMGAKLYDRHAPVLVFMSLPQFFLLFLFLLLLLLPSLRAHSA